MGDPENIEKKVIDKINSMKNDPELQDIVADLDLLEVHLNVLNRVRLEETVKTLSYLIKAKVEENKTLTEVNTNLRDIINLKEERISHLEEKIQELK